MRHKLSHNIYTFLLYMNKGAFIQRYYRKIRAHWISSNSSLASLVCSVARAQRVPAWSSAKHASYTALVGKSTRHRCPWTISKMGTATCRFSLKPIHWFNQPKKWWFICNLPYDLFGMWDAFRYFLQRKNALHPWNHCVALRDAGFVLKIDWGSCFKLCHPKKSWCVYSAINTHQWQKKRRANKFLPKNHPRSDVNLLLIYSYYVHNPSSRINYIWLY